MQINTRSLVINVAACIALACISYLADECERRAEEVELLEAEIEALSGHQIDGWRS